MIAEMVVLASGIRVRKSPRSMLSRKSSSSPNPNPNPNPNPYPNPSPNPNPDPNLTQALEVNSSLTALNLEANKINNDGALPNPNPNPNPDPHPNPNPNPNPHPKPNQVRLARADLRRRRGTARAATGRASPYPITRRPLRLMSAQS